MSGWTCTPPSGRDGGPTAERVCLRSIIIGGATRLDAAGASPVCHGKRVHGIEMHVDWMFVLMMSMLSRCQTGWQYNMRVGVGNRERERSAVENECSFAGLGAVTRVFSPLGLGFFPL